MFRIEKNRILELSIVVVSSGVELLTTLLVTKLISVYLSKSEYGFYSLILSLVALFSLLPFSSLHVAIERYIIEYRQKGVLFKYYSSIYLLHLLFFIFYFIVLFPVKKLIGVEWEDSFLVIYLFSISRIYKLFVICVLNINRKRKSILYARIIDIILQLLLLYLFLVGGLSVDEVLYSSIISSAVIIALMVYWDRFNLLSSKFRLINFRPVFKDVFLYSYPLIFWGIFNWTQAMVGRWFVDFYLEKADVANFSMIFSLSLLPSTAIATVVGNFFVPIAYTNENLSKGFIHEYIKKILLIVCAVWTFVMLFVYLCSESLVLLFLDKKYLDISWYLTWGLFGTGVYTLGQISVYELYYYKKIKCLLLPNLLPGLVTMVGCWIFIPLYGFSAAVYNNVFTYALSGALTLFFTFHYGKKIKMVL